jgi:hypothetical protein
MPGWLRRNQSKGGGSNTDCEGKLGEKNGRRRENDEERAPRRSITR